MIKPFKITDLGHFLPNKFSNPDVALDQLTDPDFVVQTLWNGDAVAAILYFRNYWGACWLGAFLIADRFPPRYAMMLRDHIERTMIEKNASRLQTESIACEELTAWHEFLGFSHEGTRKKMLFDRDYDMWAITKGEN